MEPYATSTGAYDSRVQSPTVSFGNWLVTFLISVIPLINIIMLLVWAFSASTPPSKANWAKAALAFYVILLVLGFLFAGSLAAFMTSLGGFGNHRAY